MNNTINFPSYIWTSFRGKVKIMIHGQRNGVGWLGFITQWFDWTDGCIAVTNEEMEIIWSLVEAGTPITIKP